MNYWPAEEARRQTRWYDCALCHPTNEGERGGVREAEGKEGPIRKTKAKTRWKHMPFVGTFLFNACKEKGGQRECGMKV